MRHRVKNALLHKLGFVQPPYFYTPWRYVSAVYWYLWKKNCADCRSAFMSLWTPFLFR